MKKNIEKKMLVGGIVVWFASVASLTWVLANGLGNPSLVYGYSNQVVSGSAGDFSIPKDNPNVRTNTEKTEEIKEKETKTENIQPEAKKNTTKQEKVQPKSTNLTPEIKTEVKNIETKSENTQNIEKTPNITKNKNIETWNNIADNTKKIDNTSISSNTNVNNLSENEKNTTNNFTTGKVEKWVKLSPTQKINENNNNSNIKKYPSKLPITGASPL